SSGLTSTRPMKSFKSGAVCPSYRRHGLASPAASPFVSTFHEAAPDQASASQKAALFISCSVRPANSKFGGYAVPMPGRGSDPATLQKLAATDPWKLEVTPPINRPAPVSTVEGTDTVPAAYVRDRLPCPSSLPTNPPMFLGSTGPDGVPWTCATLYASRISPRLTPTRPPAFSLP